MNEINRSFCRSLLEERGYLLQNKWGNELQTILLENKVFVYPEAILANMYIGYTKIMSLKVSTCKKFHIYSYV